MFTPFQLHPVMRRSLALAVFAGAGLAAAGAQTTAPASDSTATAQPLSFQTAAVPAFSTSADVPSFSSSLTTDADGYNPTQAANQQLASLEKTFTLPGAEGMQYGQRRRYGAPRYRGGNTNADGSEKYTGYAGGGLTIPVGTNSNYLTTSWGLQVGAGRNFNKHFGLNLEFGYDKFGLTGATIQNQNNFYFDYTDPGNTNGLDGNSHIWNFSLQPVYQIYSGQGLGAYITAGVGFYHKVANFTLPQEEEYCDPYYGCEVYEAQGNIDHYTSNAPGFDGGIGMTYKFSRFSNERLYGEVRYVFVDNQFKPGVTTANYPTYAGNNYFPENSNTTSYFPVKFGIRF